MMKNEITQPYILAFIGQDGNGILRWSTEKILAGFAKHGLHYNLIDLTVLGWQARLNESLTALKPEFCFSLQGMGMDVRLENGDNVWTRNNIPFLSCLGDNPYHAPRLHAAVGPGMYLLYASADSFQTYTRFLKGRAYATMVLDGYPENPIADRTPWREREHDIVFVKTGVDSKALRASWDELPAKVRDILLDCTALVLTGIDETVATVCEKVFSDRQIYWGERPEMFFFICSKVDFYVRALRAERMVMALMRQKALIVGDWSHLDQSRARARFHSPIAATELDGLYAESRISANTLPTFRFGMHERILAGFFGKAAVLSDTTPYLQKTFQNCPSFLTVNIDNLDQDTFTDELAQVLTSCLADPATPERVQSSYTVVREKFSLDNRIQQLLDHVALDKYRKTLGWWTFPPT